VEGLRATASFLHRVIEAEAEAEAVGWEILCLGVESGVRYGAACAVEFRT
jgi:hypothetical protein